MDDATAREAIARFTTAVGNVAKELLAAGAPADGMAAALRIQAGQIETRAPRAKLTPDERELADLARKGHEFINALQIAGIEERVAVTAMTNVAIERVARGSGAAGAAHWLRRLAVMVDANRNEIEETARSH